MKHRNYLFILLSLFSCSNPQARIDPISKKEIHIHNLEFDTLWLDNFHNSYSGTFKIAKDTILFTDFLFGTVSLFDKEGAHLQTHLGIGKGPNEIRGLNQFGKYGRKHFILGDMWDFYEFDEHWKKTKQYNIDWDDNTPSNELLNNPTPESKGIYEIKYINPQLLIVDNTTALVNIVTEHPKLNAFTTQEYYQKAKIVGQLNTRTGKIEKIFGEKSKEYLKYKHLANFDNNYLEYSRDSLFVSHEIDSLIYIYKEDKIKMAFGCGGINMNQNYRGHRGTIEEIENHYNSDRKKFGWYGEIKYFPEENIFMRVYYTGEPECEEKLQIYKNKVLIGDVLLGNIFHCKVLGKIDNEYFLYINDPTENGEYFLLKFKLS